MTRKPPSKQPAGKRRIDWAWATVIAAILFVMVFRIRLVNIPLERDEGEFAYMGQLMLQGIPPYKLAYNMKVPGIYAAYALVMALFGQTAAGIHIGLLLINIACILMVFVLVRRLFTPAAGAAAGVAFAILSANPRTLGTSAHATHFVIVCALGGLLLLLKALESRRRGLYVWSGVLFGLSFLMKQPGGAFGAFGAFYAVWEHSRLRSAKETSWLKGGAASVGWMAVGGAIPVAVTLVLLKMCGVFQSFWFWTVTYCGQYASMVPRKYIIPNLTSGLTISVSNCWPVWALAGAGLVALLIRPQWRRNTLFVLGLLLASFIAVCPGFYFRNHYFVLMLPAVAMLAGLAVGWAVEAARSGSPPAYFAAVLSAMVLVYPVYAERDFFFRLSADQASRYMYSLNPFVEAPRIADYIERHTKGSDKIAILGSEPEIYFYSHRRSASPYIYMYPLMEPQRFAARMQEDMIRQIDRTQPEYVVAVNVSSSWLPYPNSDRTVLNWLNSELPKRYKAVGLVEIESTDWTSYYWDDDVIGRFPEHQFYITICKRL